MAGSSVLIDMQNITKVYQMGKTEVPALDGVSLSIEEGEYVAIVGTSGSGQKHADEHYRFCWTAPRRVFFRSEAIGPTT